MYGVRRCPKCGGNVPDGNAVCNNCGHKMSLFGGNTLITSSSSSRGANTVPNPFDNKKNNNGCFIFGLIFLIFFGIPFFSIFYEIYNAFQFEELPDIEEPKHYCELYCDDYGYSLYEGNCMCGNNDIYSEDGRLIHSSVGNDILDGEAKCSLYCKEDYSFYDGNICTCTYGDKYDMNGNKIIEEEDNNGPTVQDWYLDATSGKELVTVICKSNDYICSSYKAQIESMALKNEFNLYYFEIDTLDVLSSETLKNTYHLYGYKNTNYVPYTFIVKNNEFVSQMSGFPTNESLESFLRFHNIIKE